MLLEMSKQRSRGETRPQVRLAMTSTGRPRGKGKVDIGDAKRMRISGWEVKPEVEPRNQTHCRPATVPDLARGRRTKPLSIASHGSWRWSVTQTGGDVDDLDLPMHLVVAVLPRVCGAKRASWAGENSNWATAEGVDLSWQTGEFLVWSADGTVGTEVCSQDDKQAQRHHEALIIQWEIGKLLHPGWHWESMWLETDVWTCGRVTKPSTGCQEWSSRLKSYESGHVTAILGTRRWPGKQWVDRAPTESVLLSPHISLEWKLKQGCQKYMIPFSRISVCQLRGQRDIRRWV